MSYSIVLSDLSKTKTLVIDDVGPNNDTSLTLFGPNVSVFGEYFWENLLHLLENFSSSKQPDKPIEGQLWYNSSNKILSVCVLTGTTISWKPITGSTSVDLSSFIDISKTSVATSLKLGIDEATVTIYSGANRNDNFACTKKFVDSWKSGVTTGATNSTSWVVYPNKFAIIQGVGSGNIVLPFEMADINYSAVITNNNSHQHFRITNKTSKGFTSNSDNWMVVGIAL
jgi:hypothetical protein